MREKIARAIYSAIAAARDFHGNGSIPWEADEPDEWAKEQAFLAADAVLEAMREPSDAMVAAGMADWLARSTDRSRVTRPYSAMIDAAKNGA